MWEFSVNVMTEHNLMAKYLYNALSDVIIELKGVITSFESSGKINILLAVDEIEKPRLEYHIQNCVSNAICTYIKEEFLSQKLVLPHKSELELYTFKKALINFDRETDKFLISKFFVVGKKNIEVESFFHFQLKVLKEKWTELVNIANDNSTYLLGDDSFVELLKFLIDNIDIGSEEVFVKICENGNKISFCEQNMQELNLLDKFKLVELLMTKSPRKINWTADSQDSFLEKVFSKRIVYVQNNNF